MMGGRGDFLYFVLFDFFFKAICENTKKKINEKLFHCIAYESLRSVTSKSHKHRYINTVKIEQMKFKK